MGQTGSTTTDPCVGGYSLSDEYADALEKMLRETGEWETETEYHVRQPSLFWVEIRKYRRMKPSEQPTEVTPCPLRVLCVVATCPHCGESETYSYHTTQAVTRAALTCTACGERFGVEARVTREESE